MKSDSEAQNTRPPMLNSDSNPANPAAIAAIVAFCEASRVFTPMVGKPINLPAKISGNIGEAMPITPMPADTFKQSTHQISQNCGVLCALARCTLLSVIMLFFLAGAVQPSGCQPAGVTRYAKAPIVMKIK